jgi:hypothetical protein
MMRLRDTGFQPAGARPSRSKGASRKRSVQSSHSPRHSGQSSSAPSPTRTAGHRLEEACLPVPPPASKRPVFLCPLQSSIQVSPPPHPGHIMPAPPKVVCLLAHPPPSALPITTPATAFSQAPATRDQPSNWNSATSSPSSPKKSPTVSPTPPAPSPTSRNPAFPPLHSSKKPAPPPPTDSPPSSAPSPESTKPPRSFPTRTQGFTCHASSKNPAPAVLPGASSSGAAVMSITAQSGSFGFCSEFVDECASRNVRPLFSTT